MSIQSTRHISRDSAISRINEIAKLAVNKDYREIESITSEGGCDLRTFVDNFKPIGDVSKWTNRMLEDYIDAPFYRFSMFDNYFINDESI